MKEKKILIKFILYFLFGFAIIFYGITHKVVPTVLAETVNVGYVTDKTVIMYENNNAQAMVSLPVNSTINQYLYDILVIQLNNQTITKNYTYMLELYLPEAKLKNINNIYVVGGNNNGTTCQTIGLDNSNTSYPKIYFKCPVNLSSLTIGLNNDSPATSTESITTASNFRWSYSYLIYYTEDNDIDLGPVISNATNNTNNIINNNNNNTQNIINNNDENTQKIIDSNKENFQTCRDSFNLFDSSTIVMGDTINANSSIRASSRQSLYLESGTYTFKTNLNLSTYGIALAIGYTAPPLSDYNYIRDIGYLSRQTYTFTLDTPGYFMVTIRKNGNLTFTLNEINNNEYMLVKGSTIGTYEKYGEDICTNKLDETKDAINGVTGALTDDSPVDMSSLGNTAGWLPAGPIDSIINLPLNFLNGLLNALNKTCSPLSVPIPFINQNIVIPCISTIFNKITGLPTLWGWVGAISSVMILYKYLIALYKYYDDLTTLKANFISDFGGAP